MLRAVLRRTHDVGLEIIVSRVDPPFDLKRLPDRFGFIPTERGLELVLFNIPGQRAQALACGQV